MRNNDLTEAFVKKLIEKNLHVCCAESCTGGLVAAHIINISGASAVINESYITYSNEAKNRILGVNKNDLDTLGAVSDKVCEQMASGCRTKSDSDIGISTTGIAGPDGGTDEKPVGTVYIGISTKNSTKAYECHFEGNRDEVRMQSVLKAIELAYFTIEKI
ncbi:MAG TPA: damage-inducible protein CinA [Eubacterium sp.]|nr:damage-inducible protein CinA [Eubacterium sp.]